jgi:taurine dioxygenase
MKVSNLRADLGFGARITGVDLAMLKQPAVRAELADVFDRRGLLVFDEIEASAHMLVAVSNIIGPLKEHPVPTMTRTDSENLPGVIEFSQRPTMATSSRSTTSGCSTGCPGTSTIATTIRSTGEPRSARST